MCRMSQKYREGRLGAGRRRTRVGYGIRERPRYREELIVPAFRAGRVWSECNPHLFRPVRTGSLSAVGDFAGSVSSRARRSLNHGLPLNVSQSGCTRSSVGVASGNGTISFSKMSTAASIPPLARYRAIGSSQSFAPLSSSPLFGFGKTSPRHRPRPTSRASWVGFCKCAPLSSQS